MNKDKKIYSDNFAIGRLSKENLDSVNEGVLASLSNLMYYEDQLQIGISKGQKWVYTNSSKYSPQNTSFDHMVESGKYGVNCAMPAGWTLVDIGALEEGMRFWGDQNNEFANYDKVAPMLEKAATITKLEPKTDFNVLYEAGQVKAGDIFLAHGHTFVYLGDELFHASGHDGKWHSDPTAETEDGCKAVFESWIYDMKSCADYGYRCNFIIRIKDDYVPRFYRNKEGKLVINE